MKLYKQPLLVAAFILIAARQGTGLSEHTPLYSYRELYKQPLLEAACILIAARQGTGQQLPGCHLLLVTLLCSCLLQTCSSTGLQCYLS